MCERQLRILLLSPLPPPVGGIASWTKTYLEWSIKNDLDVEIVNTALIGQRGSRISHSINPTDEIERTIDITKNLITKINQYKPDIVHLNTSCTRFGVIRDSLYVSIAKRSNIPIIVHYHFNIKDRVDGNKMTKIIFRSMTRKATLNIVLNKASEEYVKDVTGREPIVLANFINDADIIDKPKPINTVIKNIVFVGRVSESKGVKEIIEAAKRFTEITFTLAGPVSKEIRYLDTPKNIFMLGHINKDQIKQLLFKSDIFLFPTYTEGFSNALLEAMSMGLPIITTPVGANADMIEEIGGIMVRAKNIQEIIEAVKAMESKEIRERMSCWNVNKVKKHYVVDHVMGMLINIYKSMTDEKGL